MRILACARLAAAAAWFAAAACAGADWGAVLRGDAPIPLTLGGSQPFTIPSNSLLSNADSGMVSSGNAGMESLRTPFTGSYSETETAGLPNGGAMGLRRKNLRGTIYIPSPLFFQLLPSLGYTETNYRWRGDAPLVGGSAAPFDEIRQWSLGLGAPLLANDSFSLFAGGSVNLGYETGASLSNALTYTAILAGQLKLGQNLKVGAAFVSASRLDDDPFVSAFPTLLWTPGFLPGWTLDLGTRGPAAALHYGRPDLRVTAEVGFQTTAFRLARNGPLPGGAATDRQNYFELRGRWKPLQFLLLEPKIGIAFGRRLEFFDRDGAEAGGFKIGRALTYGANASLTW